MADGPKPNPRDEALRDRLRKMILGFQVSQCLHVAAKLGIAELLKNGSMSGGELAVATRTGPAALDRFLRALSSHGVLAVDSEGRFCSTPIANFLRSGETHSFRFDPVGPSSTAMTCPLCSTGITPLQRYYEAVRPSPAHRYFRPRGWSRLCLHGERRFTANRQLAIIGSIPGQSTRERPND